MGCMVASGRRRRASRSKDTPISSTLPAEAVADGYDTGYDWTEVVLFGTKQNQDTAISPFDDDPAVDPHWLPEYLYRRFLTVSPTASRCRFLPNCTGGEGVRPFQPILSRAATAFGRYESVTTRDGIVIHYIYDPVHPTRPWRESVQRGCAAKLQEFRGFGL